MCVAKVQPHACAQQLAPDAPQRLLSSVFDPTIPNILVFALDNKRHRTFRLHQFGGTSACILYCCIVFVGLGV